MKHQDTLTTLANAFVLLTAGLLPIWFLPVTPNAFGFQKQYLMVGLAAILLILWTIQSIKNKRILLSLSGLNGAMLLVAAVTAASAMIIPNTLFHLSGRFVLVAALAVVTLFGASVARGLRWAGLLKVWLYLASLLSILTLLQLTPFNVSALLNQALGTNFPANLMFNLAESPLVFLTFAIPVGLAGLVAALRQETTEKETPQPLVRRLLTGTLPWSLLPLGASGVVGGLMATNSDYRPILLPFQFGWSIAVESFKQLPTFLLGFGPENFINAFHRFRDVNYNMTDLWNIRFATSSSEFLHSMTTTGVLGMGASLLFLVMFILAAKRLRTQAPSLLVFGFSYLVLFFFLPFGPLLWGVLALAGLAVMNELRLAKTESVKDVVVMLSAIHLVPEGNLKTIRTAAGFTYVVALLLLVLGATGLYGAGRVYAANVIYFLSLQATERNEAIRTYDLQQQAIRLNPVDPMYRRAYANTNLAIVQAMAEQSEELSEQDRQTLAELLQQAIREARNSATLNPAQTENWETIATVYSQLLEVEGAAEWTNAAFVQAIQTDPIAPGLRLGLAGLYRQLEQPVQAQRLIEQAIELKPDWANAYFNYGDILELQEQPLLAYQAYQRTLELLPAESPDRQTVQDKLDELKPAAEAALAELQKEQAEQQAQAGAGQEEGEGEATQNAPSQITTPEQPSLPEEQPQVENPPEGFEEIISNEPAAPEENSNQGEETNENIVLPEDVGF